MLEKAGYEQYEIPTTRGPGYASVHNRAYWMGENYLGIGPSAFFHLGMRRWQNVPNYREYADRVLTDRSPINSTKS